MLFKLIHYNKTCPKTVVIVIIKKVKSLFIVKGKVVEGKKRGKQMGFPTANLQISPSTPQGTYVSQTKADGGLYKSITFIGRVETFDETEFVAETTLLDFEGNLYEKDIEIQILKKLRNNKKFESLDSLIRQMKKDKINTVRYFDKLSNK